MRKIRVKICGLRIPTMPLRQLLLEGTRSDNNCYAKVSVMLISRPRRVGCGACPKSSSIAVLLIQSD